MFKRFPFIGRSLVSALMTIAFFVACEVGLSGQGWSALYLGDPGYYWRLRTDLDLSDVPHLEEGSTFGVMTNDKGFRDGPLPKAKPWVLALGCSTTFGWGVEQAETWPELLEGEIGVSVYNAGVPGHSSEQGKQVAAELLEYRPSVVIVGWGLRDGQTTTVADIDRRPTPFPRNTSVYQWLRSRISTAAVNRGTIPRVSPSRFQDNLEAVIAQAESVGAQVVLLDMTTRSDTPSHGLVLKRLGRVVLVPEVSATMVFERDPIHFNVDGNRAIAQLLAPVVTELLGREESFGPGVIEPQRKP